MKEEKNKRNAKVSNSNKTNKLIYLDKEKLKIEKTENNSNEQKSIYEFEYKKRR